MLLRESMGLSADGSQKAFPSADIDAFLKRDRIDVQNDPRWRLDGFSEHHVVVAVDPSGGGASAFAISSCMQLPSGYVAVRASPSGQFPRRSPAHISLSISERMVKLSGAWHECAKKRGHVNGSTRVRMSRAIASCSPSKCPTSFS